ncbi:MAG: U32 family peptidase, partial [Bacteroidales bacterium]|nr:U32 family peptidase [Bacteroidales bacterium]
MQLKKLELLAPAKNKEIGIAAIACGADAVYIAGPAFGAREAAGNSVADIAELADYAHKYGARVYATVNTLLEGDSEYRAAVDLLNQLYNAGVDAALIQDFKLLDMPGLPPIELHASTQAVCRNVEQAKMLESLGFSRIVLERQLSLEQIKEIRSAV